MYIVFEGARFVSNTPDDKEMGSMRLKPMINELVFRVRAAADAQVNINIIPLLSTIS